MTVVRRWGQPAAIALIAVYLWFALGAMTLTMPGRGLDASWQTLLGWAWRADLRWGVDFIDNFGPYGLLLPQQFLPGTVALVLILNGTLAALAVVAWLWLLRRQPLVVRILFCLLLVLATDGRRDAYFMIFPLLLALASLGSPPAPPALRVMLVLAVALTGVVKWTFLVTGLGVLALIDIAALMDRKRPWCLPLALPAMACLHLAAGQSLGDLPRFVAITWDQTAGFSDAMAGMGTAAEIVAFDLIAIAGIALMVLASRQAGTPLRRAAPLLLSIAGVLFVSFKSGFVRHDWVHTPVAWSGLAVALAGFVPAVPRGRGVDARIAIAALAFTALALLQFRAFIPGDATLARPWTVLWTQPLRDADQALMLATDPSGLQARLESRREAAEANIRAALPLPPLTGTVATIPPYQADLLARHLDYRPHPTVQEHQAYTPATLAADEAFFRSDAAPDSLLFSPGSIDNRYPALAEGALWPLFLARYEPDTIVAGINLLRRRPGDWAELPMSAPVRSTAAIGDWLTVETAPGTATFVQFDIGTTWLGRLVGLAFQPAIIILQVQLADGRKPIFRLPRGLAAAGFVLAPFVPDAEAYAGLARNDGSALAAGQVQAFRLDVTNGRGDEVTPTFVMTSRQLDLSPLGRAAPAPAD